MAATLEVYHDELSVALSYAMGFGEVGTQAKGGKGSGKDKKQASKSKVAKKNDEEV